MGKFLGELYEISLRLCRFELHGQGSSRSNKCHLAIEPFNLDSHERPVPGSDPLSLAAGRVPPDTPRNHAPDLLQMIF